jgi:microcystin-dependent protein
VDGDVLGGTGGEETHTLITAEMPAHTHTSGGVSPGGSGGGGLNVMYDPAVGTAETASTGGGGAHNTVQPTIILNYIIKT